MATKLSYSMSSVWITRQIVETLPRMQQHATNSTISKKNYWAKQMDEQHRNENATDNGRTELKYTAKFRK